VNTSFLPSFLSTPTTAPTRSGTTRGHAAVLILRAITCTRPHPWQHLCAPSSTTCGVLSSQQMPWQRHRHMTKDLSRLCRCRCVTDKGQWDYLHFPFPFPFPRFRYPPFQFPPFPCPFSRFQISQQLNKKSRQLPHRWRSESFHYEASYCTALLRTNQHYLLRPLVNKSQECCAQHTALVEAMLCRVSAYQMSPIILKLTRNSGFAAHNGLYILRNCYLKLHLMSSYTVNNIKFHLNNVCTNSFSKLSR
jgi:hypothetical protein